MEPFFQTPSVTLYNSDCLEGLKALPSRSVDCCITSPPYYGLRDYQTATWEGGAEDCDHVANPRATKKFGNPEFNEGRPSREATTTAGYHAPVCPKCGAVRVDKQIGLEDSPEAYINHLVEIFREVRRVLRDDGTLWVNLGSSYASGDMNPIRSPLRRRVPSCGTNGKVPQDSQCVDHVYHDSCDEPQDVTRSHRDYTARKIRHSEQCEPQTELTNQDSERLDSVQSLSPTSPFCAHPSTTDASSQSVLGASAPSDSALAYQKESQTSSLDAQEIDGKLADTGDTSGMLSPLVVHKKGKESFFSACRRSDCNGIGRCGCCFNSLTFASLNIKHKDELNIPHLVVMALQADGWFLRQTIIWAKGVSGEACQAGWSGNPMPESVKDRCTKSHEYLFLLSKSPRYYFNSAAIAEETVRPHSKGTLGAVKGEGWKIPPGDPQYRGGHEQWGREIVTGETRNRRSVWTISTQPYSAAHFAVFPPALVTPCILAGCPPCGVVLDPFAGSGTALMVAQNLGRRAIGFELNSDYCELVTRRCQQLTIFEALNYESP